MNWTNLSVEIRTPQNMECTWQGMIAGKHAILIGRSFAGNPALKRCVLPGAFFDIFREKIPAFP
ncbi:MAG TPA: hypothetical protein IAD07_09305 [Candidatus Fimivicinus intestinavium]|nr:hypothetical protein [Candidatus Fimivicinus intestinavium]